MSRRGSRREEASGAAGLSRRDFLKVGGAGLAGAAVLGVAGCGGSGGQGGTTGGGTQAGLPSGGPSTEFREPTRDISGGKLNILLWSHFVPLHDKWFDPFAREWGERVGVDVQVDHISVADIPSRIASEMQAGEGHDLIQYIATLSQYEPSVVDMRDVTEEANQRYGKQLELCTRSSLNPNTEKYYAYAPAWAPDPGDYRKSLWEQAGMPQGPKTWDELLQTGAEIKKNQSTQLGLGMSQEIDSNMAGRALLWSFGGSVQDENENVVINSDETVAAVEFMGKLFDQAMTPEIFSWNAASNNQGLIAGDLSYILNSISAWRTAQESRPDVAKDISFVPALTGPSEQWAAEHVMYNWITPKHSKNVDAAKEFLLHYTHNLASAAYYSKLYDFPAYNERVSQLDGWLKKDPFDAQPSDKLALLADALPWSTNIGHPGPASPAIGEVFGTYVIPNMYARAARGQQSPEESVARAESEIKKIFNKWRERGLVGGG